MAARALREMDATPKLSGEKRRYELIIPLAAGGCLFGSKYVLHILCTLYVQLENALHGW